MAGSRVEIVLPETAAAGFRLHQVNQRAVGRAHRRDVPLAGADRLLPFRTQQGAGTVQRAGGIVNPDRHGAHRRAVQLEVLGRGTVLFGIQHEIDAALPIQIHRFRPVPAGVAEAQRLQKARKLPPRRFIHGKLQELHAIQDRGCRQAGAVRRLGLGQDQGPQSVARDEARGGGAKIVVENLQRKRPGVTGCEHRAQEPDHVEIALAGEIAKMPAPTQHIHGQLRRVGHLHEEQLFGRDQCDAGRIVTPA